jgi:replicative DNA helicase
LAAPGSLDPGSSFADAHHALLACQEDYFVHPAHRAVFLGIQELYAGGEEVNSLTLKAALEARDTLRIVGGYPGLVELLEGTEVGKPSRLVDRLTDLWRLRRMIRLGAQMVRNAADQEIGADEMVSAAAMELSQLARGKDAARISRGSDLLDWLQAREAFRDPNASGKLVWLGLDAFDDAIEGSAGHVVMVAARPGIGKSAMAVQAQWSTARKGIASLLVSLEMDEYEVRARYAAWRSGEGQRAFRAGHYTDAAVFGLLQARQDLDLMHHWIHPSGVAWSRVEAVIRDAVRVQGVRVVLIDHVLLLQKPSLGKSANDAACWTALSRNIKRVAQELGICVVSLCQLNRAGDGVEPKLSDMKESGGWEEDANAVIVLWPKDAKSHGDEKKETTDVLAKIAKNRSGPAYLSKKLEFRGATSRFLMVEQATEEVAQGHRGLYS